MTISFELFRDVLIGAPWLLAEFALKSSVVLLVAAAIAIGLRRSSSAVRHAVWMTGASGVVLVPALSAVLPEWNAGFSWPRTADATTRATGSSGPMRVSGLAGNLDEFDPAAVVLSAEVTADPGAEVLPSRETKPGRQRRAVVSTPQIVAFDTPPSARWFAVIAGIWLAGCLFVLARLAVSGLSLRRMAAASSPVLTARMAAAASDASAALQLRRPVRLLLGAESAMPMAWGLRRPTVLLPCTAENWTAEKLSAVLLHELAHIRRCDPLLQVVLQLGCAMYWWHPLYWLAAWRVHVERERACDDIVLARGFVPSEYARQLIDVVAHVRRPRPLAAAGIAMASSHRIENRIRSILDESRDRRPLSIGQACCGIVVAFSVCIPLAMATDATVPNGAGSTGEAVTRTSAVRRDIGPLAAADPATEANAPATDDDQLRRIHELIYILRNHRVFDRCDEWAAAIRELTQIGEPAVAELIAELNRTNRNATLRGLCFTLRAIDDPRAVPALIRNIPKGLQSPSSDCGVPVSDPELLEFMRSHDNSAVYYARHPDEERRDSTHFSYGRPVNEILSALESLTGHRATDSDKDPLRHVHFSDNVEEQVEQQQQYLDRRDHWQAWWDDHQAEFVSAEELETIGPPRNNDAAIEDAGVAKFGVLFPVGPGVQLTEVREVTLGLESYWDAQSSIDLDSGRTVEYYEGHVQQTANLPVWLEWKKQTGMDIRNQGSLKGEDLHVWLIDNTRWDTIEAEVQSRDPLDLGRESHSYLVPMDKNRTKFLEDQVGTFLFTTREGGRGIMQVFPSDQTMSDRRLRYRMWERETPVETPALNKPDLPSQTPIPDSVTVTLSLPGRDDEFLYDFESQRARALPKNRDVEPTYYIGLESEQQTLAWAEREGIDLVSYRGEYAFDTTDSTENLPRYLNSLVGLGMRNREVTAEAFDTMSIEAAREILDRVIDPREVMAYFGPHPSPPQRGEPATYVFETRTGEIGLLQIVTPADRPDSVTFKYRLKQAN